MACKDNDKFVTSEASTKAWMRTNGAIDKFLNIMDESLFRKKNNEFSSVAKKRYNISGKLFLEEDNKAIPNKKAFQAIDNAKGVFYAQEKTNIDYEKEDIDTFARKAELLKESMNVEVILDYDVSTSRVLGSLDPRVVKAGKPVILINPLKIFKTTAIHEFSHIFIDSFPKGLDNPKMQKGLNMLKGTSLWSEVESMYPELSEDNLHKEILATAIGRRGAEIWDENTESETKSSWEVFRNWVMDFLKRTFGLNEDAVSSLTRELLDSKVKKEVNENMNEQAMEERLGRFIDESDNSEEKSLETSVDLVYEQLQSRIGVIFESRDPKTIAEKEAEAIKRMKARNKQDTTAFEKIAELNKMIGEYKEKNKILGLVRYNKWAKKQVYSMTLRINQMKEKGSINPRAIEELKEYNSAFELVDQMELLVIGMYDKGEISKSRKDTFLSDFKKTSEIRNSVSKELLTAQREIYAKIMMEKSNMHQTEYINDYERQWERLRPQESKNVWVKAKMEENKEEINGKAYQFYLMLAEKSIKDISSLAGMFVNEKNISSTEIQVISRMMDAADMETSGFMQEEASKIKSNYDNYTKKNSSQNMEEKYSDLIEFDEDGHASLVSRYLPSFNNTYNRLTIDAKDPEKYNEKFKDVVFDGLNYTINGVKKKLNIGKWAKDVSIDGPLVKYTINKIEYSKSVASVLANEELNDWMKDNTDRVTNSDGMVSIFPKDKWINSRYDSVSNDSFLSFFESLANSADKLYESKHSLISNIFTSKIIRLPGITKTSMERVMEGNIGSAAIDKITDMFKRKEDEFELQEEAEGDKLFRKVFADVTNNEKLNIPIPYRGRLSKSEQSLDLHSIFLMNLEGAKNYEQKKKIEASINAVIDVMGDRMIPDYEGLSLLAKYHGFSGAGNLQVNKSRSELPNDVKKAMDMRENRLYGVKEKSAGSIAGVNIQKGMSTYLGYASNVSLVGNYLNSIINLTSGSISNIIEAAGGETYGFKDWQVAEKAYWSDIKGNLDDIGSSIQTSKTNLLMNYFNVMGSANSINNRFSDTSKFKSLLNLQSLRIFDHGGEHMLQGKTMYAILNSIKALNDKGEFINKEGEVVLEKEAMTMIEAINFKGNAGNVKLTLNKHVKANTFSLLGGTEENMLLEIRGLIKKKTIDLYGLYDENLKAAAQREWWGKLIYFLKKWIEPSATRRLRGISTSLKNSKDLREIDMHYSEDLKQYQEGYYTTAIRFVSQLIKAGKDFKLELISLNFEKLNSHEKANIRRISMELGMLSLTVSAYAVAGGYDDDPDESTLMARYLLSKEISELTYFLNPLEALRLAQSPTAALGVVNRNISVLTQLASPTEEYESGINAGRNKLYVKLRKSTPFIASFLEKDLETALRFQQNQ